MDDSPPYGAREQATPAAPDAQQAADPLRQQFPNTDDTTTCRVLIVRQLYTGALADSLRQHLLADFLAEAPEPGPTLAGHAATRPRLPDASAAGRGPARRAGRFHRGPRSG